MTSGKEIGGILKELANNLNSLNGAMYRLKDDLTQDISKEELEKVNNIMKEADPERKINEMKEKFDRIKSKM